MHERQPGAKVRLAVYTPAKDDAGNPIYVQKIIDVDVSKLDTKKKTAVKSDTWGFLVKKNDRGELIIASVDRGSPAARAGLTPGRFTFHGYAVKGVTEEPVEITELEDLKKALINLRRGKVSELYLVLSDKRTGRKGLLRLTREVLADAVALNSSLSSIEHYIAA